MKKLITVALVAMAAFASNAAACMWNSGVVTDPNGDVANKSVTAYLWAVDSATYTKYSAIADGKKMSDAVYADYGSKLADAIASGTTSKKGAITLTDESKAYGAGDTAYGVILYTWGADKNMQFMGNVGKVTFESAMNADSGYMAETLGGITTGAATAWSKAGGGGGGDVPEPTSGLLLLVGGAMLALRRKQK